MNNILVNKLLISTILTLLILSSCDPDDNIDCGMPIKIHSALLDRIIYYNSDSKVSKVELLDPHSINLIDQTWTYKYDNQGRISEFKSINSASQVEKIEFLYTSPNENFDVKYYYNNELRFISRCSLQNGKIASVHRINNLTNSNPAIKREFIYDTNGNNIEATTFTLKSDGQSYYISDKYYATFSSGTAGIEIDYPYNFFTLNGGLKHSNQNSILNEQYFRRNQDGTILSMSEYNYQHEYNNDGCLIRTNGGIVVGGFLEYIYW